LRVNSGPCRESPFPGQRAAATELVARVVGPAWAAMQAARTSANSHGPVLPIADAMPGLARRNCRTRVIEAQGRRTEGTWSSVPWRETWRAIEATASAI